MCRCVAAARHLVFDEGLEGIDRREVEVLSQAEALDARCRVAGSPRLRH